MDLLLKNKGNISSLELNCDWKLKRFLLPYYEYLIQLMEKSISIEEFVQEISTILESTFAINEIKKIHFPNFYKIVFNDLNKIGLNNLEFINDAISYIHLKCVDDKDRIHLLKLYLNSQYPNVEPTVSIDLPIPFKLEQTFNDSILKNYYDVFCKLVFNCKFFFDYMEELDTKTFILEPLSSSRSSCRRRVAISENVSLELFLDPLRMLEPPVCQFLGPDRESDLYKSCYYKNIDKWCPDLSLLENLEIVLEIKFSKYLAITNQFLDKIEDQKECFICYSLKLEEDLPDKNCDAKCPAIYHKACLTLWLKSLPTTRQSFNYLFGNCPNCNKPISIKL